MVDEHDGHKKYVALLQMLLLIEKFNLFIILLMINICARVVERTRTHHPVVKCVLFSFCVFIWEKCVHSDQYRMANVVKIHYVEPKQQRKKKRTN